MPGWFLVQSAAVLPLTLMMRLGYGDYSVLLSHLGSFEWAGSYSVGIINIWRHSHSPPPQVSVERISYVSVRWCLGGACVFCLVGGCWLVGCVFSAG